MKRVTFLIPDDGLSQWLTPLLPHLQMVQDLTIENVHSATKLPSMPKLQVPPPAAFEKFTKKRRRRGRPAKPKPINTVQQQMREHFGTRPFRLSDVQADLRDSGHTPKTLSNNVQALRMKGITEIVGGDKSLGYVYRFKEEGGTGVVN